MDKPDDRRVFFFDIDNCLYPRSKKVHDLMIDLINKYFATHLSLSAADAEMLHMKYYEDYGLAISGLVMHHKIDPLEYNREVDDALPLDGLLTPNPELRKLLEDVDTSRVVKLLGIDDLFEGITFCDYSKMPFICKPLPEMYEKAEREAGARSSEDCYFVDDSHLNCVHGQARGWTTVHLVEHDMPEPPTKASRYQIRELESLRLIFPQFFKSTLGGRADEPRSSQL
ncbi:MAG: hypothetical protein Q9205_005898 [Flavoplaca limonia]